MDNVRIVVSSAVGIDGVKRAMSAGQTICGHADSGRCRARLRERALNVVRKPTPGPERRKGGVAGAIADRNDNSSRPHPRGADGPRRTPPPSPCDGAEAACVRPAGPEFASVRVEPRGGPLQLPSAVSQLSFLLRRCVVRTCSKSLAEAISDSHCVDCLANIGVHAKLCEPRLLAENVQTCLPRPSLT